MTLALPQDTQTEAHDYPASLFEKRVWHIPRNRPDTASVHRAVEWIRNSKRPMIIAGGGVHYSDATESLRTFAEKTGIPIGANRESRGIHNVRGTAARHASIIAGQHSYQKHCQRCHGPAGYGTDKFDNDPNFSPPPINGSEAFVHTATLSYSSRFASFILNNMPPGATHEYPLITAQEALDIAEFIRVQTRPSAPNAGNLSVFYNYLSNTVMEWWFAEKVGKSG